MKEYTPRSLQPEDLKNGFFDTLRELTTVGKVSLTRAQEVYDYREARKPEYNTFVVVTDKGEVVGTASLLIEQKFTRSCSKAGHIEDVVVREEWEHRGIGSALLVAVEKEAGRQGCYKTVPRTRSQEVAQWYIYRGYQIQGFELRKDLIQR
jgi:glucosamine-phosphate N-acetyltransferase